ncbi:hypothetical protein TB1_006549 [Malus domestica]
MGALSTMLKHPDDIYLLLKLKIASRKIEKQILAEPHWAFCYTMLQKDSDDEPVAHSLEIDKPETRNVESIGGGEIEEEDPVDKPDDPMDEDAASPAVVFCIRLKQPRSNVQPEILTWT